ncbi:MAG: FkbM family methyltransferase [Planctomycetota bacterium]
MSGAQLFRRIAERLSRGKVLKRRLPRGFGAGEIYVSPECGLKFWRWDLGATDPWLLGMVWELVNPGEVVWDIGANLGLFSFAAAYRAGPRGKVLALEPDTWLVDLLRRSARLAATGQADVEILPVAASDVVGPARFNIAQRARAANYLDGEGTDQAGGRRETQTVLAVNCDWLLEHYPAPQVLKIDVEGAEAKVLAGSIKLLTRADRPKVLCEVCPQNSASVVRLLHECGYVLYDAAVPAGSRPPVSQASWNTLALPRS